MYYYLGECSPGLTLTYIYSNYATIFVMLVNLRFSN
jgi:hypothetical protein